MIVNLSGRGDKDVDTVAKLKSKAARNDHTTAAGLQNLA